MRLNGFLKGIILAALLTGSIALQGCSYMADRGRDAMDIMDIGLTVTPELKPDFALYVDFFNVTPIGYSNVDGKVMGIAYRQAGWWMDYQTHNWGVLTHGSEKQGAGVFNYNNPHFAHVGETYEEPWPRWDAGFIGVFTGDNPPPKLHHLECSRIVHVGWVGIIWDIRPFDVFDFIFGWTTFDMMGDDNVEPVEPMPVMTTPEETLAEAPSPAETTKE